jgi:cell division protein FtsX
MEEEGKKEEITEEKEAENEKPLEKMTAKELREIAREIPDISGVHAMKKEQLLEVVKEARGKEEKEKPPEKMTAKALREIAREIPGVSGVHAMKKEQLLEVIKEAPQGAPEEQPVIKKRKKAPKQEVNMRELKQKIIQFKEKKEAARLARESKTVDILRRRINRLKKRTRKVAQA